MTSPPADVNYTFSDAEIAALMPYGTVQTHEKGESLVAEGDVRAASVKRVASAVGEGSVVVSDVHRALADLSAV